MQTNLVGVLGSLKIDDSVEPVDLGFDRLRDDHRVQTLLGRVLAQAQQLRHPEIRFNN